MPSDIPPGTGYRDIARHYDSCLARFGDTARGADWPNEQDRRTRFAVMLDILGEERDERIELLDFACGTGELYRHVRAIERPAIAYRGADVSEAALRFARAKFPEAEFHGLDILAASERECAPLAADYGVVNGLFTVKGCLGDDEMWAFMTAVIGRLWPLMRRGIAFNVMSKQVDRERGDLFHVSLDRMAEFLHRLAGRAVAFRADYGLFEYTCYAWKTPRTPSLKRPAAPPPRADASMVARPLLPEARHLARYLGEIDRRRWYSNFGHTVRLLMARFAAHFDLADGQSLVTSSGTDAITAVLIAAAGRARPERPYCLMPSYTFVATAAAALNAGYQPYFVDIEPETMALDPERLRRHPALDKAGAIVVVAPYGRPIAQGGWERLAAETGIAVVIDAAAGFDAIAADPAATLGRVPVALSLHATKVFGVGEGGLILCRDEAVMERSVRAINFGFYESRNALLAGFNGKLSEYHAAVGLAALDQWPQTRAGFLSVSALYRRAAERAGLAGAIIAETRWASCYALYRAPCAKAAAMAMRRLQDAGIDVRLWYGHGCHRQPAYAEFPRDPLPATDDLAPRLIGLPMSVDMAEESIDSVVEVLAGIARA